MLCLHSRATSLGLALHYSQARAGLQHKQYVLSITIFMHTKTTAKHTQSTIKLYQAFEAFPDTQAVRTFFYCASPVCRVQITSMLPHSSGSAGQHSRQLLP